MATIDINFDDIKIVRFSSTRQNISTVEPNIVYFPAETADCGDSYEMPWYKAYKLLLPKLPTGVEYVRIYNQNKWVTDHNAGDPATEREVRYLDTLTIFDYSPSSGYTNPTVRLSSSEVKGDVTLIATPGIRMFTLTMPAVPNGVYSYVITRTPTLEGAAAEESFYGTNYQQYPTIYEGDKLTIGAIPQPQYGTPTATLSQTTVSGNVTATVIAGVYTPIWGTLWTGSGSATGYKDGRTVIYTDYTGDYLSGGEKYRVTITGGDLYYEIPLLYQNRCSIPAGTYEVTDGGTLFTVSNGEMTFTAKLFVREYGNNAMALTLECSISGSYSWENDCGDIETDSFGIDDYTINYSKIEQYS